MDRPELIDWCLENSVQTLPPEDQIYKYDSTGQQEIRSAKPWERDPNYFKFCKISAAALIKMAIHANSGGNLEVMGLMLGKVESDTMIIHDSFALPVEGTETRVNASMQAYEYMSRYLETQSTVDRKENVIGWYHSHPGYGCWLSGIDVSTQKLHQKFEEPFVAVVIDPIRTMATNKITIESFRTYPDGYKPSISDEHDEYQSIPLNKIEDFGVHCKSYYSLETTIFKSQTDNLLLKTLWNKYWASTLSASTLKTNENYINEQITDIGGKLEQVQDQIVGPGRWRLDDSGNPKNDDKLSKSVKDCEKLMAEIKYGINMQSLKAKLFSA